MPRHVTRSGPTSSFDADEGSAPRRHGGRSERLRTKIRLGSPHLHRLAARFWRHAELPRLILEFYGELHAIIRTNVPLMEEAARIARARRGEPGRAELAAYLERHADEERGHDAWLLSDLEAAGCRRDVVRARLPAPRAAALVGTQYYFVKHVHPVAILGYLAVLEGTPPRAVELDAIQARTGLPAAAFRTLRKHAAIDPSHRDDLDRVIDRLPMTKAQEACVGLSALATVEHVGGLFHDLLALGAA